MDLLITRFCNKIHLKWNYEAQILIFDHNFEVNGDHLNQRGGHTMYSGNAKCNLPVGITKYDKFTKKIKAK